MKTHLPGWFSLLFVLPLALGPALAQDVSLSTAGASYAPLDISKHASDPNVPLSTTQRQDLLSQFEGLVHLGLRNASYDEWEGRNMADCDKPSSSDDRWSYRCEVITGEGNGIYYFYPNETRQKVTLQHLDIRVNAADENLLDDFRRPIQDLFGRATFVQQPSIRAKARGPIRHWNTGSDIADLFIDTSVRPEGSVRFVWMRSPLVGGARADAK